MRDLHDLLIAGRMLGGNGGSPAPEPTLITKTITANGTYNAASDNADGYSSVTVDVQDIMEIPIESGGYSGTGVNNEGKVIGVDNTERLMSMRCRSADMPFLQVGTYEVIPSPTADNDISFALTLAALTTDSPNDITDYVFKNTMGGGWNTPGAVTITVSAPAYLAITVKKGSDASITPAAAGSYVIIQKA